MLRFRNWILAMKKMIGRKARHQLQSSAIHIDDWNRAAAHPRRAPRNVTGIDVTRPLCGFMNEERYAACLHPCKPAQRAGGILNVVVVIKVDHIRLAHVSSSKRRRGFHECRSCGPRWRSCADARGPS